MNKRVVQNPVVRERPPPAESGFQYGLDEVRLGADKSEGSSFCTGSTR